MNRYFNSNRSGHMAAATCTAFGLSIAGVLTGNASFFMSAIAAYSWEKTSSPDRDIVLNPGYFSRAPIQFLWRYYWRPFAVRVPHRSRLSHSLLIGFPLRLAYVFALPTAAVVWAVYLLGPEWAQANSDLLLAMISAAKDFIFGAAVADLVHLMKDGYLKTPGKLLWGKH